MHKPIHKRFRNKHRHLKLMLEGAPLVKKWLKFLGLNIVRGGTKSPTALTDTTAALKAPI
jgi:hypothetical protein